MALATQAPFPFYADKDGDPLDSGRVYFGVANDNPETNPVVVYWDAAATQPAPQPISTLNGFTVRSGTPAVVYTTGDYSITVRNSRGEIVFYCANSADFANDAALQALITAGDNAIRSDLANNSNVALGDALIGVKRTAVAAVATTVHAELEAMPLSAIADYGCAADGVTDDTAKLVSFIAAGGGWLGFNRTYKVNGALSLNVAISSIRGAGITFDFTGGGSLEVYSTLPFPANIQNTTRTAVQGVRFVGPNTAGSIGTTVGKVGAGFFSSCEIEFEGCSWYQFGKLVNFTDNAWRTKFTKCAFEQPATGNYFLYAPSTTSNMGEVMTFEHSWFADSTGELRVEVGQWIFRGCSFGIGATIHGRDFAVINLFGCNVESQPSTGYRMIWLEGNASLAMFGGDFVINSGTNWVINPIYLNGADTQLTMVGAFVPLNGAHLQFEKDVAVNLRDWVIGNGRLFASGLQTAGAVTLTGIGNNVNFSKLCNSLSNGDAEYGNTNNWTISTFGVGGSTVTATAGSKLNGTYGFNVATVAGGGVVARQNVVSACAGRLVILSAAHRIISGTGTTGQLLLRFLDNAGATISVLSVNWVSTDTNWSYGPLVGFAPQGTQSLQVEFNGQANAGVQQIFVDEVCLNIL